MEGQSVELDELSQLLDRVIVGRSNLRFELKELSRMNRIKRKIVGLQFLGTDLKKVKDLNEPSLSLSEVPVESIQEKLNLFQKININVIADCFKQLLTEIQVCKY
jgi:hypothetical protein